MKKTYLFIISSALFLVINPGINGKPDKLNSSNDLNKKIETIRKEFYKIEKMRLEPEPCYISVNFNNTRTECKVFRHESGTIKKLSARMEAPASNLIDTMDEYFWENGDLFFIFYVTTTKVKWPVSNDKVIWKNKRRELRFYFWKGKLIQNLHREIVYLNNVKDGTVTTVDDAYKCGLNCLNIKFHSNASGIHLTEEDLEAQEIEDCIKNCPENTPQCRMACEGAE